MARGNYSMTSTFLTRQASSYCKAQSVPVHPVDQLVKKKKFDVPTHSVGSKVQSLSRVLPALRTDGELCEIMEKIYNKMRRNYIDFSPIRASS